MRTAISRIGAGNVVDLDEIVPRYQGAMLRLAFTFLHSQSLAEDLVHSKVGAASRTGSFEFS